MGGKTTFEGVFARSLKVSQTTLIEKMKIIALATVFASLALVAQGYKVERNSKQSEKYEKKRAPVYGSRETDYTKKSSKSEKAYKSSEETTEYKKESKSTSKPKYKSKKSKSKEYKQKSKTTRRKQKYGQKAREQSSTTTYVS